MMPTPPRTLRARLVAALLVLATLGLGVAGTFSVLALRSYLTDQIDQRLTAMSIPLAAGLPRLQSLGNGGGPQNLPTDYWLALFDAAGARLASPDTQEGGPAIDAAAVTATSRVGQPTTMADSQGGSDWRTITVATQLGTVAVALSMAPVDATVNRLLIIELMVGVAVLTLLAALGAGLVRVGLRPLTRIEQTAVAIADGDLDRRIDRTDPRTEVGRLGAALNTMLGQISGALREREDSQARLRQFVADASHELRTPLTSIRGFAELGGRPGVGAGEVARGLRRIQAEAERMGVLIDDLLLLARLDARRPLRPVPVDLLVLAVDAVDDARARHPERRVTVSGDMRPLIVDGDESQLRQVLANLVNNAVLHTPPSAAVQVTLRPGASPLPLVAMAGGPQTRGNQTVEVEVRDNGPGLDAPRTAHLFDRFYRGDRGRGRATGGSGLGLSIAVAIVASHGGRIELRTTPGSGAAFRVVLPTPNGHRTRSADGAADPPRA